MALLTLVRKTKDPPLLVSKLPSTATCWPERLWHNQDFLVSLVAFEKIQALN